MNINEQDGNILMSLMVALGISLGLVQMSVSTQRSKELHDRTRLQELAKNSNLSSLELVEALIRSKKLSFIDPTTGAVLDRKRGKIFYDRKGAIEGEGYGHAVSTYTFQTDEKKKKDEFDVLTAPAINMAKNQKLAKALDPPPGVPDHLFSPLQALAPLSQPVAFDFVLAPGADAGKILKAMKGVTNVPSPKQAGGKKVKVGVLHAHGKVIDLGFDPENMPPITSYPPPNIIKGVDHGGHIYFNLVDSELSNAQGQFTFNKNARDEQGNVVSMLCHETGLPVGRQTNARQTTLGCANDNLLKKAGTNDGKNVIDPPKGEVVTQTTIDYLTGELAKNELFVHVTTRSYYYLMEKGKKLPTLKEARDKSIIHIPLVDFQIPCVVDDGDPRCMNADDKEDEKPKDKCEPGDPICCDPATDSSCKEEKLICPEDVCCPTNPNYDKAQCEKEEPCTGTCCKDSPNYDPDQCDDPGEVPVKCSDYLDKAEYYKKCGEWEKWRLVAVKRPWLAPNQCEFVIKYYERTESCPDPNPVVLCEDDCVPDPNDPGGGLKCNKICTTYQCSFVGAHTSGGTYCRLQGCFSLDTPLVLADGTTRTYATLKATDKMWNPVTKQAMGIREIRIGAEEAATYKVGYGDSELHVSEWHPFPVREVDGREVVKPAKLLGAFDKILGDDGDFHPISKYEVIEPDPSMLVYNVALDTDSDNPRDHYILANGIITGDLWMQNYLKEYGSAMPVFLFE